MVLVSVRMTLETPHPQLSLDPPKLRGVSEEEGVGDGERMKERGTEEGSPHTRQWHLPRHKVNHVWLQASGSGWGCIMGSTSPPLR